MTTGESGPSSEGAAGADRHKLLKILVWPALVLILSAMFWVPLSTRLGDPKLSATIKLSPEGLEFISDSLATAARARVDEGAALDPGAQRRAEEGARRAEAQIARLQGRTILWIDDHPENNVHLQNAFAEAGVRVFSAFGNAHARELLAQRHFDLAITDVSRDDEGPTAGLRLLPLLNAKKIAAIVYSSSWADAHRDRERDHDVLQITNDPTEVYSVAIAALSGSS